MNFLGIGPLEMLLILVLALVVLGPGRLVDTGRKVGRVVGQLRKATSDLPDLMEEIMEGAEEPKKKPPPAAAPSTQVDGPPSNQGAQGARGGEER